MDRSKPRIATCSLAGCFGCHMSLLDLDERLLELFELVDLDVSPLTDKKRFDGEVEIGIVEGGCSNEHNVEVLREFRRRCRLLVSIGACAITGGVPMMRNSIPLEECLAEAYQNGSTVEAGGVIPDDEELPRLLDKVYPCHEFVRIDCFIPGCPPSADTIRESILALLEGRAPELGYELRKYD